MIKFLLSLNYLHAPSLFAREIFFRKFLHIEFYIIGKGNFPIILKFSRLLKSSLEFCKEKIHTSKNVRIFLFLNSSIAPLISISYRSTCTACYNIRIRKCCIFINCIICIICIICHTCTIYSK